MEQKPKTLDTPAQADAPEVKTTEPAVAKPQANSDLDTVLNELKRFGGRLTKLEQRNKGNLQNKVSQPETRFSFDYPEENEPEEQNRIQQEKELLKVERGITRLIREPKYRDVFEKDKTLARILENKPLALLSEDPLDADDALNQITQILDEAVVPAEIPKEDNSAPEATPANPETAKPNPELKEEEIKPRTVEEVGRSLTDRILGRR